MIDRIELRNIFWWSNYDAFVKKIPRKILRQGLLKSSALPSFQGLVGPVERRVE